MKAILACDNMWGIGKNNDLPWEKNIEDLKWFKKCTLDSTIIMGKSTWLSLPTKPLPKRKNIVISNTLKIPNNSVEVIGSNVIKSRIEDIYELKETVWVIGGAKTIFTLRNEIDEYWISRVSGEYQCDTFLDSKNIKKNFNCIKSYKDGKLNIEIWKRK